MLNLNKKKPKANIKSIDINIVRVGMLEVFESRVGRIIRLYATLQFSDPLFCWEMSELIAYAIVVLYVLLLVGAWDVVVLELLRCLFLIAVSVKESSPSSCIRAMCGLFRPLEVCVGPSILTILTVGAVCFVVMLDWVLKFGFVCLPFTECDNPTGLGFRILLFRLKIFSSII
jgi:hypothetical protein